MGYLELRGDKLQLIILLKCDISSELVLSFQQNSSLNYFNTDSMHGLVNG